MVFVVSAVLFLTAAIFVGYPLFRTETEIPQRSHNRHETIRMKIKDLELEFEMGNISIEDYRELDAKYKAELN
ncbi:MAG: hypothetical protein SVM79_00475 [Chloroflexota bacterium]|nr:hypothetical protein [Chloroflexota bacterium]